MLPDDLLLYKFSATQEYRPTQLNIMYSMFCIRNILSISFTVIYCLRVVNGSNEFDLQLQGSSNEGEGRVEVFRRGESAVWGNICDNDWDEKDAIVACRQLGFTDVGFPLDGQMTNVQYGKGEGEYFYSEFKCNGSENALRDCPYVTYNSETLYRCTDEQPAGVMCFSDFDVRLQPISDTNEGRLELFYKGDWSNVRSEEFDDKSANVACKQVVRGEAQTDSGVIVEASRYGDDEGTCQFSDFNCKGNESHIGECDYNKQTTSFCVNVVAIKCDDVCNPSPCENDGVCKQTTDGSWICECKAGYSGGRCTIGGQDGFPIDFYLGFETTILATSLGLLGFFLILTLLVTVISRFAFRHALERIIHDADLELESKDPDDLDRHMIEGEEHWEEAEYNEEHEGVDEESERGNGDEYLGGYDERFEGSCDANVRR